MTKVLLPVAAVLVLVTSLLSQGAASASAPKARIVITVAHCGGCRVTLGRGDEFGWPTLASARVRHGRVVFTVPRRRTRGMWVSVVDRRAVFTDANAMAIMRYDDQPVGQGIDPAVVAGEPGGYTCTARVAAARVRWSLVVTRVPAVDGPTGKLGYDIRPHFSPGIATYGSPVALHGGGYGVNGDFPCVRPAGTAATAKDFTGTWTGHTRTLTVKGNTVTEQVSDGCCSTVVDATYRIESVAGTTDDASVGVTVTKVGATAEQPVLPLHVGERGTLSLSGGMIWSSLTATEYCGPATAGSCGA